MFPGVAQRPLPTPGPYEPQLEHFYDTSPACPPSAIDPSFDQDGSYGTWSSMPRAPQQIAHPLLRRNSTPAQGYHDSSAHGQSQSQTSEHMLRRKTPNGTLSAGYDGTPVEWTSKPHAMKHILLPASSATSCQTPGPSGAFNQDYNDVWGQAAMASGYPSDLAGGMSQKPTSDVVGSHPFGPDDNNANWMLFSQTQRPPVMDSVLNQVPIQQSSNLFWLDGQIPTVLQPMYQPALGPTASNGQGPFGPYWPDGAFVPYRPAAMRDVRFAGARQGTQGLMGFGDTSRRGMHSQGWVPYPDQRRFVGQAHPHPYSQGSLPTTPCEGSRDHSRSLWPQSAANQPKNLRGRQLGNGPSKFPHPQLHQREPPGYSNPDGAHTGLQLAQPRQSLSAAHNRLAPGDFNLQSGNGHFKDKVLSWAHKVYGELTASVHHSRKNFYADQSGNGHQHGPRPNIWPQPPKHPQARSPEQYWRKSADNLQPSTQKHVSQEQSGVGSKKLHEQDPAYRDQNQHLAYRPHGQKTSHAPQQTPSMGLKSNRSNEASHTAGTTSLSRRMPGRSDWSDDHHATPIVERSEISPIYPQATAMSSSPATNAMAALEMVTRLCSESNWKWVDGMLLGGCLAYGLGDYTKALKWYSKILEIDSNHVEASSNLAATLLSLNRREEAEQYWLRSVKLRPSYFEAVEHLIGLLCGDHRGSEAVSIIEFVERSLKINKPGQSFVSNYHRDDDSETSRSSSVGASDASETIAFDFECGESEKPRRDSYDGATAIHAGFGSSGYAIPGSENGRILALVHAKGNMLYALGDNRGAAQAFEDAVLIGAGGRSHGIQDLIQKILDVVSSDSGAAGFGTQSQRRQKSFEPVLLPPDKALQTSKLVFPNHGELPGLKDVPVGMAKKAAVSTTSNSLLSLAKIFQDGMSSGTNGAPKAAAGVRDILALYYLSLALQPSPSTANNVGILLASVQQPAAPRLRQHTSVSQIPSIPGVVPGSGIHLALAYYNYGLNLDSKHAHLYTNLGSLLKDIGQLGAAIKMYEQAVVCDGNFDIALANLANAVKDQGKISDAIRYYQRAVAASPDFAEAVCGLANALNSVCAWKHRGGIVYEDGKRDRWHVNDQGMLVDATIRGPAATGWIKRVVEIVEKQLREGEYWGKGVLRGDGREKLLRQLEAADSGGRWPSEKRESFSHALEAWAGHKWEGARVVKMVERAAKRLGWHGYQDKHVRRRDPGSSSYVRPRLPAGISIPAAPTVLPFHTFTCPLSAKQIRMISQRNGLRISCSTLGSPWLSSTIYSPPAPPDPALNVGYVSSDFNNHPLAHLMQSVFGFHDPSRVKAFCYATTASDGLDHRQQIEREAPAFHDASSWSADRLVKQIVQDGIHILINLNGYTRGARNEVFAARPAPVQMSFMGFAGSLGAEWCDYILADETAIPPSTLRPWRRNVDMEDFIHDGNYGGEHEDWVYSENIIFARDTFFCCDHRQSAPDSQGERLNWDQEQDRRWEMRKQLFPNLADDAIILGNFNQLYKIDPSTYRSWLRILARIPKAILWLLRFPDMGENNLKDTARLWAGPAVAERIIFTDVAPKHLHISRARVCDLFLDTPECNAHTTAADVLWSGTPLLTLQRYDYKMCSRMAASIVKGALPRTTDGNLAASELIATSEEDYEEKAQRLANEFSYPTGSDQAGRGRGRLFELRRLLYESRWTSALFDTRRWVRDLEEAYEAAWRKWVEGEGGDIWL